MKSYHMVMMPRDGVSFRDGKGRYGHPAAKGLGLGWPHPSTMRGALRTTWGFAKFHETHQEAMPDEAFWRDDTKGVQIQAALALSRPLSSTGWSAAHRMWPTPSDALFLRPSTEDQEAHLFVKPLVPQQPALQTMGSDLSAYIVASEAEKEEEALGHLWLPQASGVGRNKPDKAPSWWTEEEFAAWLCGEPVAKRQAHERPPSPVKRFAVSLSIDQPTQTAAQSMLFARERLETLVHHPTEKAHYEWAFGLKAQVPEEAHSFPPPALRLGGKQHVVYLQNDLDEALFSPPQALLEACEKTQPKGLRLFAVTPAHFPTYGWRPDVFEAKEGRFVGELCGIPLEIKSACVPRPVHVSGWDMAKRQPKKTKRLVAPGAVFFVQKQDEKPFGRDELETLWLGQWGGDKEDGFGSFVPGLWHPAAPGS